MYPDHYEISRGAANPVGATFDGNGVNFAIFSAHAEKIELCLFSPSGRRETQRLTLPERDGDIWYGYVAGLLPGAIYGYRAHGSYAPEKGHRFNPNKLLLDPYAKKIHGHIRWSDRLMGYRATSKRLDLSFDDRDSANAMLKSVVINPCFDWSHDQAPRTDISETIIYEAHVKGLTAAHPKVHPSRRGYFLGLSSARVLEHLNRLGITAVELLPPQAFVDDRFLVKQGLRNYWGYQTIGFFCPEPRYLANDNIAEFQMMVSRFHAAGIEVLIDVVYNHTAEGSELGPTLSFRGLDNASYYLLKPENPRYYENFSGTGNTLNLDHPMVLRMVLDSLRYWVNVMHVDGFRFDLASILGRTPNGFERTSSFFKAVQQDPVLSRVKLITEPWDIGPGGYQLGAYPAPFLEWNDRFRDCTRRFWKGDNMMTAEMAERLVGSARQFDHSDRAPSASVNLITAHDGFTLEDVVSYNHKHNEANGEANIDGHNENNTDNMGVEGVSDNPDIRLARNLRKRNLLTTLLIAQGTPMLLAGDEIGNSQSGNNNAYCQDNMIGWVDWDNADYDLFSFVRKIINLRKNHPILRQRRFLHGNQREIDGKSDLIWRMPDGKQPEDADWQNSDWRTLCVEIRTASNSPDYDTSHQVIFAVLNGGKEVEVQMPDCGPNQKWLQLINTVQPELAELPVRGKTVNIAATSVSVFALKASS